MNVRLTALATTAAALSLAAPTAAQTPTPTPTPTPTAPAAGKKIAQGVSAAGVDVSGLTVEEAQAKLDQQVAPILKRQVLVRSIGHVFRFKPVDDGNIDIDTETTAKRAYYAGLSGAKSAPGVLAKPVNVELKFRYRTKAVTAFAASVQKAVTRAPKDATIKIALTKITRTHSKKGRTIDAATLSTQVNQAVKSLNSKRVITAKLKEVNPAVTANTLKSKYDTVLTVSQSEFKIRLFKGLKVVKSYGVAVGQPAYPTPKGLFSIQNKQVNPTWSVPNSPWAGELQGTTVEGGSAANPLKARWMGIINGVGIHGTGEDYSIGSRASHGCIRMHVSDVIALYDRVPVGTPVLIG